ncbi:MULTISPECIES: hypothetical protein [Cryobacterium]|uniref:Secreted protein n=1 Tax=Cryobacterium breve TaxID=1259258 RepID=A0ABY2J5K0_9MICO|nr:MULTISPECIES: hypothetical protein [Cryobacterium]TFC95764.1 hypothetical protein E3T20_05210 [Cryobacterium sp. TmT3-12]TFD00203.1 hypothetical protein E3O65_03505 [Cryobacterium breve]
MRLTEPITALATVLLAATFAVTGTGAAQAVPAPPAEASIARHVVGGPVKTMDVGTTAGGRMYMEFSHTEQLGIQRGGIGAAVTLVCGAGMALCLTSSFVAPLVTTTVVTGGLCPGDERMRFYYVYGGGPTGSGVAITTQTCVD